MLCSNGYRTRCFICSTAPQHSWKLVPKQAGLLSAVEYKTREIEFNVAVVAHMQQDRQQDDDEKIFNNALPLMFEVS